jgi:hypothetical protein
MNLQLHARAMRAKAYKKVSRTHRSRDLYTTYQTCGRKDIIRPRGGREEKQTYREIFGLGDVLRKSFAK